MFLVGLNLGTHDLLSLVLTISHLIVKLIKKIFQNTHTHK